MPPSSSVSIPGPRPRLVATDLDGTLLRDDGTVSARTAKALAAVEDSGVTVVFVTARPPRWLDGLADAVGGHGVALCANGAFDYDVRERRVTGRHPIERAALDAIVRDLRAAVPGVGFAAELDTGPWMEGTYSDLHDEQGIRHGPIEDLPPDSAVGKLLARTTELGDDEALSRFVEIVGDRGLVQFSGAGGLAEISAPGVTKAVALQRFCAERDITPAEVWACGDMPNDLPMLTWAAVGIAVANAHPDVLAVADMRCASNEDDGVAQVLERLAL